MSFFLTSHSAQASHYPTSTSGPRAIDALRTVVVVVDSFVFFTHKPTTDSELCSDCAAVNAAHGVGIPIKKV